MKKVPEIKNLKVCFLNFVSLAEFRKRKFIIYLEKAIHLLVKKMLPGNILLLLSLLLVLSFLTLLFIMDNIKKAASEMKYWVKSFLWYTPYRNGPSGTSVSKTKKEDLTMRKTVMIKNVMSMSQILNQIESFIGKKKSSKKINIYTKHRDRLSSNVWICYHQLKYWICNKYISGLWTHKSPYSVRLNITTSVTVKSQNWSFLVQTNAFWKVLF